MSDTPRPTVVGYNLVIAVDGETVTTADGKVRIYTIRQSEKGNLIGNVPAGKDITRVGLVKVDGKGNATVVATSDDPDATFALPALTLSDGSKVPAQSGLTFLHTGKRGVSIMKKAERRNVAKVQPGVTVAF